MRFIIDNEQTTHSYACMTRYVTYVMPQMCVACVMGMCMHACYARYVSTHMCMLRYIFLSMHTYTYWVMALYMAEDRMAEPTSPQVPTALPTCFSCVHPVQAFHTLWRLANPYSHATEVMNYGASPSGAGRMSH